MVFIPSPSTDPDAILAAVRHAVKAAGGKRVSLRSFVASSGIPLADVFRHYARWEDAIRAAGFDFRPVNELIAPQLLLADWGALARALQKLPSKSDYRARGKYSTRTLELRFGSWSAIPGAFLKYADAVPEWADLKMLIPKLNGKTGRPNRTSYTHGSQRKQPATRTRVRRAPSWAKRSCSGPIYGAPLDFGALRHAPVNEDGVIFLFGMMAERLGFLVEALRPNFPDCDAKRKINASEWQRVRIEFEYESRNFRDHGHDAAGCDLIVCWAHNWLECPVEVLALGEEIARMTNGSPCYGV